MVEKLCELLACLGLMGYLLGILIPAFGQVMLPMVMVVSFTMGYVAKDFVRLTLARIF